MKRLKLTALKNAILLILAVTLIISAVSCKAAGGSENTSSNEISGVGGEQSDDNSGDVHPAPEAPVDAIFKFDLTTSQGVTTIWHELEYGYENYEVKALQQKLVDLGFLDVVPCDYFGNMTYEALINFERCFGKVPNGKVDKADLQTMNRYSANIFHTDLEYTVSELTSQKCLTDKNYDRNENEIKFIIINYLPEITRRELEDILSEYLDGSSDKSVNYLIDFGGLIFANVLEKYGSWTSDWRSLDERSINIVVSDFSNDSRRIKNALTDLCADLIGRYPSIGESMVYDAGDKDTVTAAKNASDPEMLNDLKGNVLLRRWNDGGFEYSSEPYAENTLNDIVTGVNEKLGLQNNEIPGMIGSSSSDAPATYDSTSTVNVGGVVLKSQIGGAYSVKGFNGFAVRMDDGAIKALAGISGTPFVRAYDITPKKNPAAFAAIDGGAASVGATVLGAINVDLGQMTGGKFSSLPGTVEIPATLGVANAGGRTLAVVKVLPGGASEILPDTDENALTVTFPISGGLSAYAVIAY